MLSANDREGLTVQIINAETQEPLNEYDVVHSIGKDGEPPYTTCFLETIDEPFAIRFHHDGSVKGDWRVDLIIDGNVIGEFAMSEDEEEFNRDHVVIQEGKGKKFAYADLRFAPLHTLADGDSPRSLHGAVTPDEDLHLGTIVIDLGRGIKSPAKRRKEAVAEFAQGQVNEKKHKLAYTVKPRTTKILKAIPRVPRSEFEPFEGEDDLYYRFVFKTEEPVQTLSPESVAINPPRRSARLKRERTSGEHEDANQPEDASGSVNDSQTTLAALLVQMNELQREVKRLRRDFRPPTQAEVVDLTMDDD